MEKRRLLLLFCVCMLLIVECGTPNTSENMKPTSLYKANPSIDLIVYNNSAYVNAKEVDWVIALNLEKKILIGSINRTGITSNFKEWDATILSVGTQIYETEKTEILFVEEGGDLTPYLLYVEG